MTTTINASNSGSGGLVQTADASGILALQTAGTTAVTVDTSQNVGIGTTGPSALGLQVTKGSGVQAGVAITNPVSSWAIRCGASVNYLDFTDQAAGERMRIDSSGNLGVGASTNNVYDQVAASRALVVQKSDTSTTLNGSTAAVTIVNGDTTTSNTAQLNFAAITGASASQYSSAIISCIFGARTNTQYPTGQLVFSTSTSLNSAPTEKMRIDSSGNLLFNSGYGSAATAYGCRVWVNFNGTTSSPSTIRGSGNVSSVTKNGTGDFTINFTTALVDTNYAPMITADRGGHAAMGYKPTTIATSSYRFTSVQQQGTALDSEFTSVTIFR